MGTDKGNSGSPGTGLIKVKKPGPLARFFSSSELFSDPLDNPENMADRAREISELSSPRDIIIEIENERRKGENYKDSVSKIEDWMSLASNVSYIGLTTAAATIGLAIITPTFFAPLVATTIVLSSVFVVGRLIRSSCKAYKRRLNSSLNNQFALVSYVQKPLLLEDLSVAKTKSRKKRFSTSKKTNEIKRETVKISKNKIGRKK